MQKIAAGGIGREVRGRNLRRHHEGLSEAGVAARLPARQGAARPRHQKIRGRHPGRCQAQAHRRYRIARRSRRKKSPSISQPDIEEIQFGRGQNLQFAATIETAPEFQLPEYKGLPVKREIKSVTDADVERALDLLAQQHTKFETVARELKMGDVAVVNYTGTSDGKPLTEIAPTAKGLTEQKNFWVDIAPEHVHRRFCRSVDRREGGRQAHGQRGFSRRFRDEGTGRQKRRV